MDENLIYAKEWKDKPVIEITEPETITVSMGPDSVACQDIYVYDNSHVIFKGQDLGSFTELVKLREDYDKLLLTLVDLFNESGFYVNPKHCYDKQNKKKTRIPVISLEALDLIVKKHILGVDE